MAFDRQGPEVSVLMPVLNGRPFDDEAIASIRAQTHGNFEFLIVDGGSTDGTLDDIARHASDDARIRLIALPGASFVVRLNHGLKLARAPIVARMDADDVALPRRLETQLAAMAARPALVLLGSATLVTDAAGVEKRRQRYALDDAALRAALLFTCPFAHPATILRRDVALRIGGYREEFAGAEDHDFWLRLSAEGEIGNLAEALLRYRRHDKTTGLVEAERQALASAFAVEDHFRRSQPAGEPTPPGAMPKRLDDALHMPWPAEKKQRFLLNYYRSLFFGDALRRPEGLDLVRQFLSRWDSRNAGPGEKANFRHVALRTAVQLIRFGHPVEAARVMASLIRFAG